MYCNGQRRRGLTKTIPSDAENYYYSPHSGNRVNVAETRFSKGVPITLQPHMAAHRDGDDSVRDASAVPGAGGSSDRLNGKGDEFRKNVRFRDTRENFFS